MPQRTEGTSASNVVPGGSISQAMLAKPSVGTPELIDASVTLAKLAADSVNASKIVDLSVGTAELANLAVTLGKLAADSVDSSKIVNDSIVNADINAAAGILSSKLAGYGAYPLVTVPIPAAAQITISGIPQGYKILKIILSNVRSANAVANDTLTMRFNNVATATYGWRFAAFTATYGPADSGAGSTSIVVGQPPGASAAVGNVHGQYEITIPNYTEASNVHGGIATGASLYAAIPSPELSAWSASALGAITRIDFFTLSAANFNSGIGGVVKVYGLE